MVPELRVRTRAKLMVLDFSGSADRIMEVLKVTPTRTWRAGDLVTPRTKHTMKRNGWSLASPAAESSGADEVVRELLKLFPTLEAFHGLPQDAEVQLTISVLGHKDRPGVFLSKEVMRSIAAAGASLDIERNTPGRSL